MSEIRYEVNINEAFQFEFKETPDLDIVDMADGAFHILQNGKPYKAKVIATDYQTKTFSIEINGNKYHIQVADKYDLLVKKLGLSTISAQKINEIKAPMPGLVLEIEVKVGQEVKKGDGLLILEAMKMENIIKSLGDGVVKSINVEKGNAVDKGEILIEME